MISFNSRIVLENLWRNKVFSSISILGLALSIASCLLIALYIQAAFSYDGFQPNLESIYRVTEKQNRAGKIYKVAVTPPPLAPELKKDFPEIVATARLGRWAGVFTVDKRSYEEKNVFLTENNFLQLFNFPMLKGDAKKALLSPDEVVITATTARRYFGEDWMNNRSILEQTIRLDNVGFKLVGVVADPPKTSSIQFDILLPLQYVFNSDRWSYEWSSNNYHTYIQLKAGMEKTAFEAKIANQLSKYNAGAKDLLQLQPLKEQYLQSKFDFNTDWGKRSDINYVGILAVLGILLLIISCVNFINHSLSRSLKMSREARRKKIIAATRTQLVLEFLKESLIVTFLSGCLSLLFIRICQPMVDRCLGTNLLINIWDRSFAFVFLSFVLIIIILAGLYPAVRLSSFKTMTVATDMNKMPGEPRSGKALLLFQFAVFASLMISGFVMCRQLDHISGCGAFY